MPNTVIISGFKEFSDLCKRMPDILEDDADQAAKFAAETWEQRAKRDAPKDVGFLAGSISNKKVSDGHYEVVSEKDYSPYMEWGTRLKVSVPAELSSYASQFTGGTGQKDEKKFIYAWAQRKGIDPEAWYPIFISIMRTGVNPHPFFFVQKPIVEQQFINDLKQVIAEKK